MNNEPVLPDFHSRSISLHLSVHHFLGFLVSLTLHSLNSIVFVSLYRSLTSCNYLKNRQHSLSLLVPLNLLFWVSFTNSICIALGLGYLC